MASSAVVSASETGVRSGLVVDVQVERPEAAHGDRVGVIGEQVGQPKVVGQTSMERIARPCSRGVGGRACVPTLLSGDRASGEKTRAEAGASSPLATAPSQRALRRGVIVPATAWDSSR